MIPVNCASEPAEFDARVRQRGLSAIDELVGRKPRVFHRGPHRKQTAQRESEILAEDFPPFWRDALPSMLEAYQRRCAFLALHIEPATGNPTVDHMIPKSRSWKQVYEWTNYRLCAALVNANKGNLGDIVDPFLCEPGWFELEFIGFQVIPGTKAPRAMRRKIDATLVLLNKSECCQIREHYVAAYESGEVTLSYLERRAPFVTSELRRQNLLRKGEA